MNSDLVARTRSWIAGDPDPETAAELERLIAAEKHAELAERMNGTLAFGTAGLRGKVEGGSNRMNRAVIIRTTRGLADYLLARDGPDDARPVVVGRDARLSSRAFFDETVAVLLAAGLPVRVFLDPVPTPLVAYACRRFGARAGVVVTASHNPPQDNGYKVFDRDAVQIVPPVDAEIAASIEKVGPACSVPRATGRLGEPISETLFDEYLAEVFTRRPVDARGSQAKIVYTPMHGVGWRYAEKAMRAAGHGNVVSVPAQRDPDGRFPTVRFPNPEEPGALDLALALARAEEADLVLANDPDADRLAVCVPAADGREWVALSGNQIGLLLADFLLEAGARSGGGRPLVVSTVVSSPMLARIARDHGARFEMTLTGFKWIMTAAQALAAEHELVFGYEEALGYSVGPIVRDKDGISADVLFADLAEHCRRAGESVLDRLGRLYGKHGLWVSVQKSLVRPGSEGLAEIRAVLERLGEAPPGEVAGRRVLGFVDSRRGADERPRWLAATTLLALELEGNARILARPSGTEPKLKIYVDLAAAIDARPWRQTETEALDTARILANEMGAILGLC